MNVLELIEFKVLFKKSHLLFIITDQSITIENWDQLLQTNPNISTQFLNNNNNVKIEILWTTKRYS